MCLALAARIVERQCLNFLSTGLVERFAVTLFCQENSDAPS